MGQVMEGVASLLSNAVHAEQLDAMFQQHQVTHEPPALVTCILQGSISGTPLPTPSASSVSLPYLCYCDPLAPPFSPLLTSAGAAERAHVRGKGTGKHCSQQAVGGTVRHGTLRLGAGGHVAIGCQRVRPLPRFQHLGRHESL
jgi:hypothetical protein